MLASRPLEEKTQRSAVAEPDAGRARTTGFPASVQELAAVEKKPSAATSRSTLAPGADTPAVVGSTTTMSRPSAEGEDDVSEMTSSFVEGATMTTETWLDAELSGLRIWMGRVPEAAMSAGL